jgi:hypothetical protein
MAAQLVANRKSRGDVSISCSAVQSYCASISVLFVSAERRIGYPGQSVAVSVSVGDPDLKASGQTDYKLQVGIKLLPKRLTFANLPGEADRTLSALRFARSRHFAKHSLLVLSRSDNDAEQ